MGLLAHGILRGRTKESWLEFVEDWILDRCPQSRLVLTRYTELIFPRVAMIRNRRRVPLLVRKMVSRIERAIEKNGSYPRVFLVGHSNGAVLVLAVLEQLAEKGYFVDHVLLIAPAVPSEESSVKIGAWIEQGRLMEASLLRCTKDAVLWWVDLLPKIVTWPWGPLGKEGWKFGKKWNRAGLDHATSQRMNTIDLDKRHSEPLADEHLPETVRHIIGPVAGVYDCRKEAA